MPERVEDKTICDLNAELQIQREERVIADSMVTYLKQKLEDQESDISTLMETIDNIQNDLRNVSTDLDTKNVLLKTCAETIEILINKNQKDKDEGNRDIISTLKRKRDINQNNTMSMMFDSKSAHGPLDDDDMM